MQVRRLQVSPRIFLSYAHEDKEIAQSLAEGLRDGGAEVWLDEEALNVGDSLVARIEAAIRSSDLFLILISPASERSAWVSRELGLALGSEQRTRVVPVLLSNASVPSDLQDILYLKADPNDLGKTADQILRASQKIGDEGSLSAAVEQALSGLKVKWRREPSIAGVRPDFLVESEDGKRVVIEVKGRHGLGLVEAVDARSQAARIRDLTHSDAAIVVVPQSEAAMPDAGIVGLSAFPSYLVGVLAATPQPSETTQARPEPVRSETEKTIFASMPFKPEYEDVYWFAMAAAAETVGATCIRVDREDFDGDITTKIAGAIESAIAVIADLSESNPDVLYEVGYARKDGTPCVQICSSPLEKLPFNVRNVNTLRYQPGQIHTLREPLIKRLKAVLP